MKLREVRVEPVTAEDEARFQRLMQAHHSPGVRPKTGQTLGYVARWHDEWVALLGFSSSAWSSSPAHRRERPDQAHQRNRYRTPAPLPPQLS